MSDSLPRQKKLISISEAAKSLGVSIDTVRRWDKSGVLHSERPDGKNRYFSQDELEKHKIQQPLTISEVSKQLGISATTLRRLEARGVFIPKRNNAGERVYDKDSIENFLNSGYFLRKKQIKENIAEPLHEENEPPADITSGSGSQLTETGELTGNVEDTPPEISSGFFKDINLDPDLKLQRRIPEFLVATVIFFLLFAIGVTNIQVSKTLSYQKVYAPAVLSTSVEKEQLNFASDYTETTIPAQELITTSADTESTPSAQTESTASADPVKHKIVAVIKTDDREGAIIYSEPSNQGEKTGTAHSGDAFDFVSINSGWYGIKLADGSTGFISAAYVEMTEETND